MIIDCPSCAATYDLPETRIGQSRKVRCSACGSMWLVERAGAAILALDVTPMAVAPEVLSPMGDLAEKFEADDLRLAGLDRPSPAARTDYDGIPVFATPKDEDDDDDQAVPHLKSEATTIDDPTLQAEAEPDNSQDDVDALFGTPTVADFADVESVALDATDDPSVRGTDAEIMPPRIAPRRGRLADGAVKPRRSLPLAAAAALLIFIGLGASVVLRARMVAALPQTAQLFAAMGLPVNLRGLEIRNVGSTIVVEQGVPQLIVEGELVNIRNAETKLSRLRFSVRSDKGQEVYSWKAAVEKSALEVGEVLKFRRKLASPPEAAFDVAVRFETRGDMVAGVQ